MGGWINELSIASLSIDWSRSAARTKINGDKGTLPNTSHKQELFTRNTIKEH